MKKTILWIVACVFAMGVVAVIVVGMGVGREASTLHDSLEAVVQQHLSRDQVSQKLAALGLTLEAPSVARSLSAKGNKHSLLVYGTWLTVNVKFDPNNKADGYHLDRASEWF